MEKRVLVSQHPFFHAVLLYIAMTATAAAANLYHS
jgi:hypothetical protein